MKETTAQRNARLWDLTSQILNNLGFQSAITLDTGAMHAWPKKNNKGRPAAFGTGEVVVDKNPLRLIRRVEIRRDKARRLAKVGYGKLPR
jgi:hypothetical protein